MKKFKIRRAAVCLTAALSFTGIFGFLPVGSLNAQASMISEEQLEKAFEEEFGDLSNLEDLAELDDLQMYDDEYDEAEIDQFAKEYLEQIGGGDIAIEEFEQNVIKDPPLKMKMTKEGMIRYTLPNGDYYDSSVPNGIITGNPVTLDPSAEVMTIVTKDGETSSLSRSGHFSEPGNYHIKLLFYKFATDGAEDYNIYEVNHYFTIVGRKVNHFGAVPAPDGFEIVSAKKDGVPLNIENPACLFLGGDGVFEIRYRDIATGSVYAVTSFERDITAPFLAFSKDISDGEVAGPVEFTTESVSDQVYLTYNGHTAKAMTNVLTTEGPYILKVEDEVGNSRLYRVTIKQNYSIFESRTIILALMLLLGSGVYLAISRRDMKAI